MNIAFEDGIVRAEMIDSKLCFNVRDLCYLLGVNSTSVISNALDRLKGYIVLIKHPSFTGTRAPNFIRESQVLTFMDNIHVQTRVNTMMFMHEFSNQFMNPDVTKGRVVTRPHFHKRET